MIYMVNKYFRTAKSADYLGNMGYNRDRGVMPNRNPKMDNSLTSKLDHQIGGSTGICDNLKTEVDGAGWNKFTQTIARFDNW